MEVLIRLDISDVTTLPRTMDFHESGLRNVFQTGRLRVRETIAWLFHVP